MFRESEGEHQLREGDNCLVHKGKSRRGGLKVTIEKLDGTVAMYVVDPTLTVHHLRIYEHVQDTVLLHKGAVADDGITLVLLSTHVFVEAYPTSDRPSLRTWKETSVSNVISLAELCEWFGECDLEEECRSHRLLRMVQRWKRCIAYYHARLYWDRKRGGAGKRRDHKSPWESTATVKGTKLLTDYKDHGVELKQVCAESIGPETKGVGLCLIATWVKLKEQPLKGPLALVFPGHCEKVLVRLGAPQDNVKQHEVILADPDLDEPFPRKVTTLCAVDGMNLEMGSTIKKIEFQPVMTAELLIELDTRWSPDQVKLAAQKDWPATVKMMLAKLVVEVMTDVVFFGLRSPQPDSVIPMWTARTRLTLPFAEKALCGSGTDGLFVRPSDTSVFGGKDTYAIVWTVKHEVASTVELNQLLTCAGKILGHRGVARSLTGLGLRVPWSRIAEARKLLKPDHPMWTDQNIGIKDRLTYVVKNCPSGTSASDIVKAMNQLEWPVLPQRQLNKGATCTWWISAEGKPKVWYFQWSGQSIVIEAEDPTRLTTQRRDQNKRKAIGEKRMEEEQERGATGVGGKADPLEHRDGAAGANPEERLREVHSLVRPLGLPVWFLLGLTLGILRWIQTIGSAAICHLHLLHGEDYTPRGPWTSLRFLCGEMGIRFVGGFASLEGHKGVPVLRGNRDQGEWGHEWRSILRMAISKQWLFRREFQDLSHARPDIERTMSYHRTLGNPQEKLCLEMVLSGAMLTRARVHKREPHLQGCVCGEGVDDDHHRYWDCKLVAKSREQFAGGMGDWPHISRLVGWVLEGDHHTLSQIKELQSHMLRVVSHFLHLHQKSTFLQDGGGCEDGGDDSGGGSRGVSGDSGVPSQMSDGDRLGERLCTGGGPPPPMQGKDAPQEGETTNWDGRKRGNKRTLPLPEHIRPTSRSVLPGQSAPKRLQCICGTIALDANRTRFLQTHMGCAERPRKSRRVNVLTGAERKEMEEVLGIPWSQHTQRAKRLAVEAAASH